MESFGQVSSAGNYEVYTGVWTDWTHGSVLGATITLNGRDGALLIAFIAVFVTVVGTSFWRISCFAIHQFSSTHVAQDALYNQRQAIFRNAANGTSGLWSFLNIWWQWRKTTVDRPSQRLLPAIGFAICCIVAIATVGIFSSKISTVSDGVLVRSPDCGILMSENNQDMIDMVTYYFPWAAQATSSWSIYAQNCYLNVSDLGTCNSFVKPQLEPIINRNASCPFQDDLCKSRYGNIEFEIYINSHVDLGLNAPPHERILFRRVSSCAPIRVDGYRTVHHSPETALNYSHYHYGPTPSANYTYQYPEVVWGQSPSTSLAYTNSGGRYTVEVLEAFLINGSYSWGNFEPIPALRQQDADVHLIFLSANNIVYVEKVSDPLYAASTVYQNLRGADAVPGRLLMYRADQPVSVLACTVKEQYCNPNLPSGEECAPFSGTYESHSSADGLWKSEKQRAAFRWMSEIIYAFSTTIEVIPAIVKAGSLLAAYKTQGYISGVIPDNQWQLEAESWHAATLVALQGSMTQVAKGTSDEKLRTFMRSPNNTDERNLCNNQKIPIGAYSNFSVFGLSFTLALGSIIIILSYALESLTGWFQKRRKSDISDYARLEWVTHEMLQLQRQAYEQAGIGVWEGCASSVPVTKGGERLAALSLENPDCPRLKVAPLDGVVVEAVQVVPEGGESGEEPTDQAEQTSISHGSVRVDDSSQSGDHGEASPEHSVTDNVSVQSGRTQHTETGN